MPNHQEKHQFFSRGRQIFEEVSAKTVEDGNGRSAALAMDATAIEIGELCFLVRSWISPMKMDGDIMRYLSNFGYPWLWSPMLDDIPMLGDAYPMNATVPDLV